MGIDGTTAGITAGATATGALAGALVAAKKNASTGVTKGLLKTLTEDQYVTKRFDACADDLAKLKPKYLDKFIAKAKADYASLVGKVKATRVKWIAGLAAAGLVVGATLSALVNKNKSEEV